MKDNLLIFVCATQGRAPEWILILPLGPVPLRDSRPPIKVEALDLKVIIAKFTAEGLDLVVDYEHQSLGADKAPAAGWIKELQAREDGLWARVEWTEAARRHIEAGEYRYYSPVLKLAPETRRPLALMHAALTNTPAMSNLPPLLAAKYGGEGEPEIIMLAQNSQAAAPAPNQREEATAMLKKLIEKLGLKPEATEEEVLALVARQAEEAVALKQQAAVLPEIAVAAGLKPEATASEIQGALLALKQGQQQLTTLQTEVAELKAEAAQGKAEKAVEEALAARKITPAQRGWALKYAAENPEGFAAYAQAAVPVLMDNILNVPKDDKTPGGILDEGEQIVCKQLGVDPKEFLAAKQAQA